MVNNFILSYNSAGVFPSEGQLLNYIRVNRLITSYYQPFAGTYLLKSDQSAFILSESFKAFFEIWPYILIQYNSNLASGSLPHEIWTWVNHGTIPVAPPPPSNALGGNILEAIKGLGLQPK